MKRLLFITAVILSCIATNLQAQQVNININIDNQPAWGPSGYQYVDYYYLPDINVYYILGSRNFVYYDGGRWITARYLPHRYRNYDLYNMYKVVLVGGPREPWRNNSIHYRDYNRYRNYKGQSVIRDSRDARYAKSRANYSPWYRESSTNRTSQPTRTNQSSNYSSSSRVENRTTTRDRNNISDRSSSSSRTNSSPRDSKKTTDSNRQQQSRTSSRR